MTTPDEQRAPIKTLHITNYYHSASGGVRTFYLALLEAADHHRREVRLVVPGDKNGVEEIGAFGRIYTVAAPRTPLFDPRYRLLLPHLYALPYRSRLREILRTEKPDLVEVCDKYTLPFLPSVLRRNWIEGAAPALIIGLSCERMDDNVCAFVTPRAWGQRFAQWYMKRVYAPRFDGHISNSDYTAAEVRQALSEKQGCPCVVCPMGVDIDGLRPQLRDDEIRRSLLLRFPPPTSLRQTRLLLYVGRLSPEKNLGLLPETMRRLAEDSSSDYRLLIAGSGPLEEWLEATAEKHMPGRVRLLNQITSRKRLAEIYANCDVLVHPNPREPFGIVPIEAMASGLPVVAPNQGGVLSYASHENSWLAAASGEAFSDAVRAVFADGEVRAAKVSRALETASAFRWSEVTTRFFALYDEMYLRMSGGSNLSALSAAAMAKRAQGAGLDAAELGPGWATNRSFEHISPNDSSK